MLEYRMGCRDAGMRGCGDAGMLDGMWGCCVLARSAITSSLFLFFTYFATSVL